MHVRTMVGIAAATALALAGLTGCAAITGPDRQPLTSGIDPAASAALPEEYREAGLLDIAIDLPYPPLAYLDDDGYPVGVDVDLGYAIGEKLGIPVKVNKQAFDTVIPSLQAGINDLIISGMNDTIERQETLDFIEYLHAGFAIAVKAGNAGGITDVLDLCGLTISSQKASTTTDVLRGLSDDCTAAGKPPIGLHELASVPDSQTALQAGNVDAFIGDAPIMAYLARTVEGSAAVELLEFPGVPKGFDPVYTGIGVLKSDPGLAQAVLLAMRAMEADGSFDEILERGGLAQYRVDAVGMNLAKE